MKKNLLLAMMVGVLALLPRAGWAYPTYHENYHDFEGENGLWYVINDDKTTVRVTYREPFQLNYTPNEIIYYKTVIPETVEHDGVTYTVTAIGDKAFQNCVLMTECEIPSTVTSIGKSAFYRCDNLKSITIPPSVTSVGTWTFDTCCKLESVDLPGSIGVIPFGMFTECMSLKSIVIPEGIKTIETLAFDCCTSLETVVIPSTLDSINYDAFNSSDLKHIQFIVNKPAPPVADKDAFVNYDATVYVPGQAVDVYKEADNWSRFEILPIGDVNSDEAVNTGDVSAVYGTILGGDPQGFTDLNCDGSTNTGDVSALYQLILGSE